MARPGQDDEEEVLPEDAELPEVPGFEDDEGGDTLGQNAAEETDEETEERQVAQSRPDKRVRQATEAAREAQERLARLERELQELRSQRQQPAQPQEESDEQFNARIALLTTEERIDAKMARAERRHQQQLAAATFTAAERADKAAFDARAASDPKYKRYADKVEQILTQERQRGNWGLNRDTVLKYVIGEAVLANAGKVKDAQKQGQRNIERQRAATTGGRGDQAPARRGRLGQGNTLADLEARLTDVFI